VQDVAQDSIEESAALQLPCHALGHICIDGEELPAGDASSMLHPCLAVSHIRLDLAAIEPWRALSASNNPQPKKRMDEESITLLH
jgi:hypothetical protein